MDFKKIETKWQKKWAENKIFKTKEGKKYYVLEMFPYPSGAGLHMGHALNYTIGDIYVRLKRMQGFNVLYPMGYDSFGLPAENAAIKAGEHPKTYTDKAIKNFINQQKLLGLSYDWNREIQTSKPEYYKWNQYFFLKFLEKKLVYRKKAPVNWCHKCNTVLANEQVHNGKCWRHTETNVIEKELKQWFIKTTAYSNELLEVTKLNWPNRIKIMQKNWIGKSQGFKIRFKLEKGGEIEVFTTRPDTIYGVTFLVYSIHHPKVKELVKKTNKEKEIEKFHKNLPSQNPEDKDKEGVFLGKYAIHPLTKEKIPIYASNFVLAEYATGVIMGVPAHDQRDYEFAKKYDIPIKIVIQNKEKNLKLKKAYTESGILVNSKEFNGIQNEEAKQKITEHLQNKMLGTQATQYKLRDWLVSRQRYWGTPIPIIYCDVCGDVPVPEKNLPIILPEKIKFGKGNPLTTNKEFINTTCPKCGKKAKRETDTMDTFFDSSWYYLRFIDPKNDKEPFNKELEHKWMPVDQYIGGAEHACMHLIYARFFYKALRDLGKVQGNEPFKSLFNQGLLHGSDGNKMSKSLGNVINPVKMIQSHSADSLRLTLMSLASPDSDSIWNDQTLDSNHKWIKKITNYFKNVKIGNSTKQTESKTQTTLKTITADIENFKHNLAIIKIKKLFEQLKEEESKETLEIFIKLLHPFCPHVTEELWELQKNKSYLSTETWPNVNESKIDLKAEAKEEIIEQTKKDIEDIKKLTGKKITKIKIFIAEPWKYNFIKEIKRILIKTHNQGEIIKKLMATDLKNKGREITKLVPRILKDRGKLTNTNLTQEEEITAFKEHKIGYEIEIIKAQDSQENKAKQALPGKPAIILK